MRVVLVRPRDPNNVGAAARAMANFGFDDLVVVDVWPPTWREARAAVGAERLLASARTVATLEEAIGDRTLVGATTAGQRRALARTSTPEEFFDEVAREAAWATSALVFGNEKSGLAAEDLARCHVTVQIPTSSAQPSMNLAAAVAVCCYQAALARAGEATAASPARPRRRERRAMVDEVERFVAAAFPPSENRRVEAKRHPGRSRLRALLLAARASAKDLDLLHGLVRRRESDNDSHV